MLIEYKSVIRELIDHIEIASSEIKMSIWSHNLTTIFWEGESILDKLAFTVIVHDLESVDKLSL
jgi:hypothetical protein